MLTVEGGIVMDRKTCWVGTSLQMPGVARGHREGGTWRGPGLPGSIRKLKKRGRQPSILTSGDARLRAWENVGTALPSQTDDSIATS